MSNRTFVTGFGSFGDIDDNPSAKLAAACGRPFEVLEVAFVAVEEFLARLDPASFDRLLMLGVAADRDKLTPEVFARNHVGSGADVRGEVRHGSITETDELLKPGTLFSAEWIATLTIHDPVAASLDAGSYLCNFIYYRALETFPAKRVGFLHVPAETAIPLENQQAALADILAAIES